jgi:hypothetical protein
MTVVDKKGSDIFLGFGPLITLLVLAHVVAFAVWLYLLIFGGKPKKQAQD